MIKLSGATYSCKTEKNAKITSPDQKSNTIVKKNLWDTSLGFFIIYNCMI